MTPDTNFDSTFFNPSLNKESFVENEHNPDIKFYYGITMVVLQYLAADKFKTNFKNFFENYFFTLYLYIRSINESFESFNDLYSKLHHKHWQVRKR